MTPGLVFSFVACLMVVMAAAVKHGPVFAVYLAGCFVLIAWAERIERRRGRPLWPLFKQHN